jgi:hypothetical protein
MEILDAVAWLLLGTALGVALALVVLLVARRRAGSPATPEGPARPEVDFPDDDLPRFLDAPPGSPGAAPRPAGRHWVALSARAAAPAPPAAPVRDGATGRVLAAMTAIALLLIGSAAVVAATDDGRATTGQGDRHPRERGGQRMPVPAAAELTFGGLVLERRAVGITATYPVVELVAGHAGRPGWAAVELPTYNCLTAEAPADPVAAGCLPSMPEYAELAEPLLTLDRDGEQIRFGGRFATATRPNGGPPQPTGRVYEIAVAVVPQAGGPREGWVPADGVFLLGNDRAASDPDLSRLHY